MTQTAQKRMRRYRHAQRPTGYAVCVKPLAGCVKLRGERVAELRRGLNLAQLDLAMRLGVTQNDMTRVERGKVFVSDDYARAIAGALGVADYATLLAARVRLEMVGAA